MIPRAMITEWRENAPWVADEHVEQDLILSQLLVELFANKVLQENIAFRGGTALFKLFLAPPVRYSEDLDFVQVKPGPIGDILDIIRSIVDPILGQPKRKFNHGRMTLTYTFLSESIPPIEMRIKIETNTREHFTVFGYKKKNFSMKSRWFTGQADVLTYTLDELVGTKLRALYQRKKGRDLFDLWITYESGKLNLDNVVESFLKYMAHGGHIITRALFEKNMYEKLKTNKFLTDITPLLAPGIIWDRKKAVKVLKSYIVKLPGEPWAGGEILG